jgi:hypothetical protein
LPERLDIEFDAVHHRAHTRFDDANVLVAAAATAPVTLEEEEGWTACEYGKREPRKAIHFRHAQPATATFLTLVVPYRGATIPQASATLPARHKPGDASVEIQVEALGKSWTLTRDNERGQAKMN